jgi:thioesterase domain-containing protein
VLRYGKGQDQGVEEIAARYLEAIRAEQPDGPFSLLGVSFGGVLAFEMAQQMARAGEPVPLVVVLDIPPVEERRSLRRSLGRMRSSLVSRVRALLGGRGPSLDAPVTPADLRKGLYERAMRGYRTSPYPGRLLVVRASERRRTGVGADPALGWGEHVANLAAIDAPGDHLGILRSAGVPVIAETLRRELP